MKEEIIEKLSPIEIKIMPFLNLSIEQISEKSKLDETSIHRALMFLKNKGLVNLKSEKKTIIELGRNGAYYKKNHLPERNLLKLLEKTNRITLEEARKNSKLSENEFKVSIGLLKSKSLVEIKDGKLILSDKREEFSKKFPEEQLLEILPCEESSLNTEQKKHLENLKKRKEIIEIKEKRIFSFELTESGKKIAGKKIESELLEEVTPEMIKNWKKNKEFRKYDIHSPAPKIKGGRRHFVNHAINEGKRIWLDMGFTEMDGKKVQTSFWNFDSLFTAQDHPVREMHDTFYIKKIKGKLPKNVNLIKKTKQAHEEGVENGRGWNYEWSEEDAERVLLRTHTTCLSAQTLSKLKKEQMPAKFFAIGKVFRNETVDWTHGFEFNQTEGIVIDPNANFRNLIGYLMEFAKKMGFEKIRIQPAYFPYTEPSIEGAVWNEEKKQWVEVLAAGIFRPEVTIPLLGENIPVLAWGPGFDRLMMFAHKISDLRDIYKNDIKYLRERRIAQ